MICSEVREKAVEGDSLLVASVYMSLPWSHSASFSVQTLCAPNSQDLKLVFPSLIKILVLEQTRFLILTLESQIFGFQTANSQELSLVTNLGTTL